MALNGTPAADNLSARFDGDAVYGLGGRDMLTSSSYVDTLLDGGVGNDQLATYYDLALVPDVDEFRIAFSQVGGLGNDRMRVWLYGQHGSEFSPWIYASVNLTGGDGLDEISVNLLSSDGFFETSNISAGAGDDVITVSEDVRRSNISTMEQIIDAGEGNDQVVISTLGGFFSVENTIVGGGGNDRIFSDAVAFEWNGSSGATARNEISGGLGDDMIQATAHGITDQYYATGQNIIRGDGGNDRIAAETWNYNELYGGTGDDVILATLIDEYDQSRDSFNILDGGEGDDFLSAAVRVDTWGK